MTGNVASSIIIVTSLFTLFPETLNVITALINIATSKLNECVYALIKINLPEALSSLGVITFYELAELVFFIYLIVLWIRTIYCINKK